jgi:peptidoglycan/LPS O-acetylase OafA/YrhL
VETLDGLRGFLALSVFLHHTAIYHSFLGGGAWAPPANRFYAMLGPTPVAMFFMITGFLFWSQILAKKGRPDWIRLYVGRIFRIGPIYLCAVAVMLVCVFVVTGAKLSVSPGQLAKELAKWLALGAITGGPVNGYDRAPILLAKVTWSLSYEWAYYASLVLTALSFGWSASTPEWVRSLVASIAIVISITIFNSPYEVVPLFLLATAFFLIADGATLFGLLKTPGARRLGDISFGIYLLQGLVMAAAFALPGAVDSEQHSPVYHWLIATGCGCAIAFVSMGAHVLVERPGVDLGRVATRLIRKDQHS